MSHYHNENDMKLFNEMSKLSPAEFKAWLNLDNIVGREGGEIPKKYRDFIALAVAFTTQCPYCIEVHAKAAKLARRPRVYFEEWDEPQITGIRWVAELVRIAGGDDIFPERALEPLAKQRILEDGDEVIRRAPDIILGSWCGKRFRPERVAARPGWEAIPAVRDGALHEIKSPIILQPGPAALTDGVAEIARIIRAWADARH